MSAFDNWLKDDIFDSFNRIAIESYESGKTIVETLEELHRISSYSIESAIYNVIDLYERNKEVKDEHV